MRGDAAPRRCARSSAARRARPCGACWRRPAWCDALDQLAPADRRLLPDLVRHHRLERRIRQHQRQIARADVAAIDDRAVASAARLRRPGTARLPRSASAWPTGRCAAVGGRTALRAARATAPDARRACCAASAWISSTMTRARAASIARPDSLVSSRYSDSGVVTRICGGGLRIATRSACGVSPVRTWARMAAGSQALRRQLRGDAAERQLEIALDVVRQRLERRDVDDLGLVGRARRRPPAAPAVDGREKRRQRLARAGRRGDQYVAAARRSPATRPPAPRSARRNGGEPAGDRRMKLLGCHRGSILPARVRGGSWIWVGERYIQDMGAGRVQPVLLGS